MTGLELGRILKEAYENAPRNEAVAQIHLFGIRYAKEIQESDSAIKEIIKCAGIKESYATEVSKGIKLARYVKVIEGPGDR